MGQSASAHAEFRHAHALSVDVEDWNNHVVLSWAGKIVPPTRAVVRNTEVLLDLVLEHKAHATWFILGEIAEKFPGLIRKLANAGQEIGVHGFHHEYVYTQSEADFRRSIQRAKAVIEQAAGVRVLGHRAPAFSINRTTPWAFEVLAELGFTYDSSVFPARTPRYGDSSAPLSPYQILTGHGELTEVPLSVLCVGPWRFPCCGGGYLRHFPLIYNVLAMRRIEREQRRAVFYLHPHEIDSDFDSSFLREHMGPDGLASMRWNIHAQYHNRKKTIQRVSYLLSIRRFEGIARLFGLESKKNPRMNPAHPHSLHSGPNEKISC